MTELKARIKVMPVHAFVMIFAALYSFVSIFIPMFELFVQYVPFRTYSLFTLLLNPRVFTRIRSGSVNLNFQQFAAWAFVITIVLAVAALTLALSYPFYYNSGKKRKIGYLSVLVLFVHVVPLAMAPKWVSRSIPDSRGRGKPAGEPPEIGKVQYVVEHPGKAFCRGGDRGRNERRIG